MAVIQTAKDGVRYMKRRNLEEEARIVGNEYSDLVRQFGIDCVYHKLNVKDFDEFKGIIDRNAVLKRAYGYDITPRYDVSADMVTFAEIDSDFFQLNKVGLQSNSDVTFVFDRTQFACDLAPKLGQYAEYAIEEKEVCVEVPSPDAEGEWPREVVHADEWRCGPAKGLFRCVLSGYSVGETAVALCDPYENSEFEIRFPKNDDLYRSLSYSICHDDYLEAMIRMKYSVEKVQTGLRRQDVKYVLKGKISGSVLFFDLERLGKYAELIHPDVGDIVAIDFPDENNREKYEITECFDKQLSQDGVNPLLHKYVWKCKARRYVNSYEEGSPEQNEADARLEERRRYDAEVQEEVAKAVSDYDPLDPEKGTEVDAVYGGYERPSEDNPAYDKEDVRNAKHVRYDRLDFGTAIDIVRFGCGSRLVTDGYALVFVTAAGDPYEVAPYDRQDLKLGAVFESGLRWLKATDSRLVFVNIEGQSTVIADGDEVPQGKVEICLNSAHDVTLDPNAPMNQNGDNFVKFRGTRTLIWATEDALYARLDSGKKLCQLI